MAVELVHEKSVVYLEGDAPEGVDCIDHSGELFVRDGDHWRKAIIVKSSSILNEAGKKLWQPEQPENNTTESSDCNGEGTPEQRLPSESESP